MFYIFTGFIFGWFFYKIYKESAENKEYNKNKVYDSQSKLDKILQQYAPNEYLEKAYEKLEGYQKKKILGIIPVCEIITPVREMDDIEFTLLCKNYNKYVDSGKFPLFTFTYDDKLLISLLLKTRQELREKVENIQKA